MDRNTTATITTHAYDRDSKSMVRIEVYLEIDLVALATRMGKKAFDSKSKKSIIYGGTAVAKVTRS
jgi:hypothetical protein